MEDELKGKIVIDDTIYETYYTKKFLRRKQINIGETKLINAFIPGVIKEIFIKKGDKVSKGQPLLILEAMKMKNRVFAPHDGVIEDVLVKIDDKVSKEQPLMKYSN